jgi:SAM-dependent methyltransferase
MGIPVKINPDTSPSRLYENIEYTDFWSGAQKAKLDQLEHILVKYLLPPSGRRIVDVGCGYGRLIDCYMGRFDQIFMVDPSMSLLRQSHLKMGTQACFIAADVNHLPFRSATFDAALMIRVFQHLNDSRISLSELHRILGNGNKLVFNYCNKLNPAQIVKWMLRIKNESPFNRKPSGIGTTFISHHPTYVGKILHDVGFSDIEYCGAGILDKFAGEKAPWSKWLLPGINISKLIGKLMLAPWIFCGGIAQNNHEFIDTQEILNILQCPACSGELIQISQSYKCVSCHKEFPITREEGIIDFRID